MPTGLRRPEAKTRRAPLAGSISSTAARSTSSSSPFSPTLELEPTPTYSLEPSAEATRLLVQWWLRPAGRSATLTGVAVIWVWPA
ncbi:hypothetical protein D3C85_1545650 [compost metagenome]